MKRSKRYKEAAAKIDGDKQYGLREAVELFHSVATAKFNESMELHIRLGVDPRHADQQVRSTVVLPHGTGVTKRVLVLATGEKVKEAEEAGADVVGGEDLVQKIAGRGVDADSRGIGRAVTAGHLVPVVASGEDDQQHGQGTE